MTDLPPEKLKAARDYIATYWSHLEQFHPQDEGSLIGLPKPYLTPSSAVEAEFDYEEMYYWDSYFMAQGLLDAGHKELVMGMLDDLVSLFERFGIVPNASRLYHTSRTQPPLLTSFIFDIYDAYNPGLSWLEQKIRVAQREYKEVWMGTRKPNARLVHQGLSRYYDFNYLHDLAEAESGWDMTPRFGRKALNYLPVDLNALLYKYEKDFARTATLLGKEEEAAQWEQAAEHRKKTMDTLMWSEKRGLYFDYNFVEGRRGTVASLASYYPLWVGMVDAERARRLVHELRRFEYKGGLSTTDRRTLRHLWSSHMPEQWAYPNGWAPLQFIVIEGLKRYGYQTQASHFAQLWLKTNLDWFVTHGVFMEKYNVVNPTLPPSDGIYPAQTGFGWTNAIFERLCREFVDPPAIEVPQALPLAAHV